MTSIAFDTLSAAEALEAAGIDKAHAKAIAVAIRNGQGNGQGDLATKADHNELRNELRTEIGAVRSELSVIRWVVGIQSEITLATFAIVAAKLL